MTDFITATFNFQRTAVEQTHQATLDAIEASTESVTAAGEAIEESEAFVEGTASFTRQSWHAYFDALEANLPEDTADFDRFRAFVDDAADASIESQAEFRSALVDALDENGVAFESAAENYTEVVDDSFEAALEAHEEAEAAWSDAAEEIEITE
jgi:hypothetical protein